MLPSDGILLPNEMPEFYDDYQGNSPVISPDRVGTRMRSGSRSVPNSYASSSSGRTRHNSKRSIPRVFVRTRSNYEEEEEGYGSGEYDDGPIELSMIRVKVCSLSFIFGEYFSDIIWLASLSGRRSGYDFDARYTVRRLHGQNHGEVLQRSQWPLPQIQRRGQR